MKKLLGLLFAVVILATCSCGTNKTESEYIELCKTDSVVVGFEYAFLYNDSIAMIYKVFNPKYLGLSSEDGNFVYADTSDLATIRGYWLCVQQLDRGVPRMPSMSNEIKFTIKPDWLGFIKWRDGK